MQASPSQEYIEAVREDEDELVHVLELDLRASACMVGGRGRREKCFVASREV